MAGLIEQLTSLLQQQLDDFETLIGLSSQKKEVLIKSDVAKLIKITSIENSLLGKSIRKEKEKNAILKDISMVLNRQINDVFTLTTFLDNKKEGVLLSSINDKLNYAAEQLREANNQNKFLLERSLEYIDFSVNLIRNQNMTNPQFCTSTGQLLDNGKMFFDASQ